MRRPYDGDNVDDHVDDHVDDDVDDDVLNDRLPPDTAPTARYRLTPYRLTACPPDRLTARPPARPPAPHPPHRHPRLGLSFSNE
jgi:hypothetical protein